MASDFADDQIEELLERTEKGEALSRICEDPRMPGRRTVYDWLDSDDEGHRAFAAQFRAARARGVHFLAEQCIEIADEKVEDAVEVAHNRLRIDTRLRLAGKWLPSSYGDKVQVDNHVSGSVALDPASLPGALAFLARASGDAEG